MFVLGGTNTILWLSWCAVFRHRWKHVRKCATSVVMLTMSVLLETADFAPVLWLLDAHALWHLITAPLPIIWYRFGEILYILNISLSNRIPYV